MGLFRRTQPPPSSGHTGDDQTLKGLRNVGADDTTPRVWEHFLYCDDEEGAARLEAEASAAGWNVTRVDPAYHGIVAERSDLPVNATTVSEARQFFEGLTSNVPGGDYDGWGAEGG